MPYTFKRQSIRWALAFFCLIVLFMLADVIDDYEEGQRLTHISIELLVLLLALSGGILLGRQYYLEFQQNLNVMHTNMQAAQAEAQHWRAQSKMLIAGLGAEIQKQFTRWGLSRAESEIGLLILKGLSHQEIAAMRDASERTVREQARAVYRKAGLRGKAELSAFFLEDLLLPNQDHITTEMMS